MNGVRQFFESTAGKIVAIVLVVVAGGLAFLSVRKNLGPSDAASLSRERHFVCSETGKHFKASVEDGKSWPRLSPHSGKETGYPAEQCFWTAEGKIKSDPTYVLVGHYLGSKEPTFCPDCGRLVVAQNPPPSEGHPPPLKSEYKGRKGGGRE